MQETLGLGALRLGVPQVWGTVRLTPILRPEPIDGLRLHPRCVDATTVVVVKGTPRAPETAYISYVPHAFVVRWKDEGAPMAARGTQMMRGARPKWAKGAPWMEIAHRMARREAGGLRFLPLHLAMEGYLALQFGGPTVMWKEYSEHALRRGLSPRVEWSLRGSSIPGLDDALRLFEIHDNQVGALLFVGDVLAAAFVVPHALDYRGLHGSLLTDFFGDQIFWYAMGYSDVPDGQISTRGATVRNLDDIRRFLDGVRSSWADTHRTMADGLFGSEVELETVQRLGPFALQRFVPSFDPERENHIGERIVGSTGELAYLKTYRLSAAQVRRGYLLKQLAAADWNLDLCAEGLGIRKRDLVVRLKGAGFGYLLRDDGVRDALRPSS